MIRPGKIPAQAGFEPGTFRSLGGRLNHLANEAVGVWRACCTMNGVVVVCYVA